MNTIKQAGIEYIKPTVYLLQETGLGTAEFASRTAYDSFDKSENRCITELDALTSNGEPDSLVLNSVKKQVNGISGSELLNNLAWVHFHHSVLEHSVLTFLIKGTSRACLQEFSRHRIQSLTVRSTRYTMSSIINAFIASLFVNEEEKDSKQWFHNKIKELQMFIVTGEAETLEIMQMYNKLYHHAIVNDGTQAFIEMYTSKDMKINGALEQLNAESVYDALQSSKQVRNIGDDFKWIVTDNWKTDIVMTVNLRALKNFYELRDSGAAYFLMQILAQEMKKATPDKYLRLIDKKEKGK